MEVLEVIIMTYLGYLQPIELRQVILYQILALDCIQVTAQDIELQLWMNFLVLMEVLMLKKRIVAVEILE